MTEGKVRNKIIDLRKAIIKLEETLLRDCDEDDIVLDATIKRFEFTYEVSWKLMKSFLEFNGNLEATSPRRAIQEAFKERIIKDGDGWLMMLQDRSKTLHTYDRETALEIYKNIKDKYIHLIKELHDVVNKIVG